MIYEITVIFCTLIYFFIGFGVCKLDALIRIVDASLLVLMAWPIYCIIAGIKDIEGN